MFPLLFRGVINHWVCGLSSSPITASCGTGAEIGKLLELESNFSISVDYVASISNFDDDNRG